LPPQFGAKFGTKLAQLIFHPEAFRMTTEIWFLAFCAASMTFLWWLDVENGQ
jgi:hypothetical protein